MLLKHDAECIQLILQSKQTWGGKKIIVPHGGDYDHDHALHEISVVISLLIHGRSFQVIIKYRVANPC
jgi:hypothetical protein